MGCKASTNLIVSVLNNFHYSVIKVYNVKLSTKRKKY